MKTTKNIDYSVAITYDIESEPVSSFTSTENFIGEEMHVVSFASKQTKKGFYNDVSSTHTQYILSKSTLENLQNYPEKGCVGAKATMWLVKDNFLPLLREYGSSSDIRDMDKATVASYADMISDKPFDDAAKKGFEFVEFVANDHYLKIFRDHTGQLHCEPFTLDYIGGKLNNEQYFLDDLVEHLMYRTDIAFIASSESTYKRKLLKAPLNPNSPDIQYIITDIPHYNSEENCNECIALVFYPQHDDIEKILAFDKQTSLPEYIVQELIGGKSFLKEPEPVTTPTRKFKRN